MKLPLFYKEHLGTADNILTLDEATSKHIIQVLRMKIGEALQLTDGLGNKVDVEIIDDNRKKCGVSIIKKDSILSAGNSVYIAISPLKNSSRFEWFLEKATEIGVRGIIPLICERTEKQQVKPERLNNILVSAMLQSQQVWMPKLIDATAFQQLWKNDFISAVSDDATVFIAHCEETSKKELVNYPGDHQQSRLILIGPEGDFTQKEIDEALAHGAIPVALGNNRLRTETAGIVAATLLRNI